MCSAYVCAWFCDDHHLMVGAAMGDGSGDGQDDDQAVDGDAAA